MPKLNGIGLFQKLKESIAPPKAFILITSHADRKMVEKAVDAGVTDYVLKPFDESVLKIKLLKAYPASDE